jgi:methylated-DNA-protein-cysteine methyltransferase-like protein
VGPGYSPASRSHSVGERGRRSVNLWQARMSETYQRIYQVVERIPRGRVATYGQIAKLAGIPGHARQVGYALSSLSDGERVAWHRVINSRGEISARSEPNCERHQRALLEHEGIVFDEHSRVSLRRFLWQPKISADPRRDLTARSKGS